MDYVKSIQKELCRTIAATGAVAAMSYGISQCAKLASYGVSFPVDIYAASGIAAAATVVNHVAIRIFKLETVQNKLPECLTTCKYASALGGALAALSGAAAAVGGHAAYTSANITKETGFLFAAIAIVTAIANHFPRPPKDAATAKVEATA